MCPCLAVDVVWTSATDARLQPAATRTAAHRGRRRGQRRLVKHLCGLNAQPTGVNDGYQHTRNSSLSFSQVTDIPDFFVNIRPRSLHASIIMYDRRWLALISSLGSSSSALAMPTIF